MDYPQHASRTTLFEITIFNRTNFSSDIQEVMGPVADVCGSWPGMLPTRVSPGHCAWHSGRYIRSVHGVCQIVQEPVAFAGSPSTAFCSFQPLQDLARVVIIADKSDLICCGNCIWICENPFEWPLPWIQCL